MGFYFAVHTTTAYNFYFTQFKETYLRACGGGSTCNSKQPSWLDLKTSVEALYGGTSDRANHWRARGIEYGVDQ